MIDLLVIGAGLSGLSGALAAAKAGLRVRVVAKGLGALHWHAGTIDLLGHLPVPHDPENHAPENPDRENRGREAQLKTAPRLVRGNPLEQMDALPPGHPYRLLSPATIAADIQTLAETLTDSNLPFFGTQNLPEDGPSSRPGSQENLLLPTAVGALRPTWLAPAGQIDGRVGRPEPMCIVGFEGLRDFYPALIAENLMRQGIQARAVWLKLDCITRRRDSNTVHLAQSLDEPAVVERLANAIRPLVQPGERVGLPAILGLDRHAETLNTLRAALGMPVFEIPTLPPSVPGIRIYRSLFNALAASGVRVESGMEILRAEDENPRHATPIITSVTSATAARPLRHRARAFLLATGGILGGGLQSNADGQIWEPIFGAPLAMPSLPSGPDDRARAGWFRPRFLDHRGQPIFSAGIRCDAHFQPQTDSGQPYRVNLWAAGNGLAHCDGIREHSMEGIAIASGMAAARSIVEFLGRADSSPP